MKKMNNEIAIKLIEYGFVNHRIDRKTKEEIVCISESGKIALELLLRFKK